VVTKKRFLHSLHTAPTSKMGAFGGPPCGEKQNPSIVRGGTPDLAHFLFSTINHGPLSWLERKANTTRLATPKHNPRSQKAFLVSLVVFSQLVPRRKKRSGLTRGHGHKAHSFPSPTPHLGSPKFGKRARSGISVRNRKMGTGGPPKGKRITGGAANWSLGPNAQVGIGGPQAT